MGAPQHLPSAQVPFAIVPLNITMSRLLNRAERAVWTALASHAEGPQRPYARPSVGTIASITGVSVRHAQRALRSLEAMGAIALYRERPGCPNEYWLNFTFGVDEESFLELMEIRAARQMDPAQGMRQLEQTEFNIFPQEPEQLEMAPAADREGDDHRMSPLPDHQATPPPDHQASHEETSEKPKPNHPSRAPEKTPDPVPSQTEVVLRGEGGVASLSEEDIDDLSSCVQEAVPVFDGLAGRPPARELVDAALCVPWLGKKFKMNLLGIRAHCISYARIEAKRHWSTELQDKLSPKVVTRRAHPPKIQRPTEGESLPEGVSVSGLMNAFRSGGPKALSSLLNADR